MKKFTLLLLIVFSIQLLYAQNEFLMLDADQDLNTNLPVTNIRAPWDTVIIIQFPPALPTSTAAETDGNHYYVTGWFTPEMKKYDMQGNLLKTFTIDSLDRIRDLAYDGQYYYGATPTSISDIYVIDFDNEICVDTIHVPYLCRSLAYNDDDSLFYSNNWSNDIMVFNHSGTIVDTIFRNAQTHLYGSYYGLAYDNWTAGGPYLWAFSQEGPHNATLVQLELPSGQETGFYKDIGTLALGSIAGGLFTYPDYDSSIAVIGGVMQNDIMFGLELVPIAPPPASYQIGGNLTAASASLDEGEVDLYRIEGGLVEDLITTGVNNLGNYLFTEMIEGDYMIHAQPETGSTTAGTHIPTYHDGNIHWENVSTIFINANSLDNNIELVEMATLSIGEGYVDGNVYDISTDTEIPVQDAQVMLLNEYDECIAIVYTDSDGAFSYQDIALEAYGLLVEIPGKTMEPMSFVLTGSEPGLSGVILYVMDGSIMVGVEEQLPSWINIISEIYPNPAKNQAYFDINVDQSSRLKIRILTVTGQFVQQESIELRKGQNRVTLDLQELGRGVFYVNLELKNESVLTRKLIKIE